MSTQFAASNGWGLRGLTTLIVCGCVCPGAAYAAEVVAPSCLQVDVQAAIGAASVGDTVRVPAGSASWSGLRLPDDKRITLLGAGKDATVVTGSVHFGASGSRVSGFTFTGNPYLVSYGYGFRLDHCRIERATWSDAFKVGDWSPTITQMPHGLIDNCEFINSRVNMEGTPYMLDEGDQQHALWALPLDLGGPGSVYLEDNTFSLTHVANANAIDANYGGSFVARYNILYDGMFIETHSSQEGGNRSGKSFEVYGNVIDLRNDMSITGGYGYRMRGGTGLIFMNDHLGTWSNPGIPLDNVRSYASSSLFGLLDGTQWGVDGNFDATGWPGRDQIGRGPDSPRWSHDPVRAYTQSWAPAYFWGNRNGSSDWPAFVVGWSSEHIKADRDFFSGTPDFDGTSGMGYGPLADRPTTCTPGVAYWATDQDCTILDGKVGPHPTTPISGTLYTCTSPGTWTASYTPYPYPHPMRGVLEVSGTGAK